MKLDFKKNLGSTDKTIRVGIALILIVLVYNKTLTGWLGIFVTIFAILQFIEVSFSY